jgi:hypothetical protein
MSCLPNVFLHTASFDYANMSTSDPWLPVAVAAPLAVFVHGSTSLD